MEKFKHCEKDVKIKPYSKEGLNMREKIDPKEVDRRELIEWIAARIANLKLQIEKLEAEAEQLTNMTRKGRKDVGKMERFAAVERHIEHERWHVGRLELINRLLENCTVDTEKV
ncbi:MAG: CCR4-Not complex component, Not N-terminal domain-containing protein [Olpidium bornovanus]|uniref:CCR4-Not complex component, Not N-terminal domain-containing protein n=1 Tax=Olpidium bornovanus TaxID=278681 RepID=A0A8H7ZWM2_9FUNG|nr:MAG: CCR4-Not complex component, Not N-terminal domain-containing protein [Olpidium bornovanus]